MLVLSALLGVMWCQNPSYEPDPGWQVPPAAAAKANPLARKADLAGGGKKLFTRNCVECHGEDGSGMEKKHSADLQLPVVQSQSDGALFWKITEGRTPMPTYEKLLKEEDRWAVVNYVRTLVPREKKEEGGKQ
jgi:mono/diheme cytochrome c family protein